VAWRQPCAPLFEFIVTMNPDVNDLDVGADGAADPAPAPTDPAGAASSDELARAVEEREQLRDRLLRTAAEFDNFRKRIDRERREMADRVSEGVLLDVLPIVDDLERALSAEAGGDGADAYRRGVELIHRQLTDLLARRGVKPMEALGADFDPHLHQAVASEPAEGHRDGEVIAELRRGYLLNDRLLRPAMVKVAQA
jgi:molecular chaperone GrpE